MKETDYIMDVVNSVMLLKIGTGFILDKTEAEECWNDDATRACIQNQRLAEWLIKHNRI